MNSQTKNVVLYGSFGLLLLLAAAAVKSFFTEPVILTNIERVKEIRDDSITYWKDRYGREHAQKLVAEASLAEIKAVYGPVIDSVMMALKLQGKQLNQLTIVGLASNNKVPLQVNPVPQPDSTTEYQFSYRDTWINAKGVIGKSSYLDYTTYDSLIATTYTKRRGFLGLGARETFIDVYSINPHSKITGLQGISILKERPKRFGLGPYIGYGWNGQKWAPNVGIGLNYSLIKF